MAVNSISMNNVTVSVLGTFSWWGDHVDKRGNDWYITIVAMVLGGYWVKMLLVATRL